MTVPDFALGPDALGALMPMHLCLDGQGIVRSVGPTLGKITAEAPLAGRDFFEAFEVRRPGGIGDLAGLAAHAGERLFLMLEPGGISLRGVAVPLAAPGGGMIVNLSFGIALSDAVGRHGLTDADFAPTDLAVEMLYLLEAKNSVMEELHNLNRRLQDARLRAEEQALTDTLTGLCNRRAMDAALARLIAGNAPFGLMHIDLDGFKQVNDTLGHPIGDRLLQEVAERIRHSARAEDVVARLGGDEFAVFQRGIHSAENAALLGSRLIERVSAPYRIDGHTVEIGASIGIALVPADGSAAEDVMKAADVALYHAKANGRGVAHFFEPRMIDQIEVRRSLEDDLRRAVEERQFELHYQPIHNLGDGGLVGFEALCRWRHPERGLIPPSDFIPLAEETGLITRIGVQVIDDAVAAVASWPSDLHVAVNLSPLQLKCPGLLPTVLAALSRHGLQGHRLELEITEAVLLREDETIIANLNALDAAGVRLAMDDFGTGYSSLSYLRRFPFKKVKIDRSFVQSIHRNSDCQAIVEASAMLARRLGITATAEGIETAEELDIVRALGCDQAQGFLLGRPTTRDAADQIASGLGRGVAQAS